MSVGFDKAKNIKTAVSAIYEAKNNGANLVALPECFNSPYGTSKIYSLLLIYLCMIFTC